MSGTCREMSGIVGKCREMSGNVGDASGGGPLYIGVVYIPPEYSSREKRLKTEHFQELSKKISSIPSEKIILIGDFNASSGRNTGVVLRANPSAEKFK